MNVKEKNNNNTMENKMNNMKKSEKILTAIAFVDTAYTVESNFKEYTKHMKASGVVGYAKGTFYLYTLDFHGLNHADVKKVVGWLNRGTIGITEARKWAKDQKKHY
jgi:Zn-dependent membrane protease YugP